MKIIEIFKNPLIILPCIAMAAWDAITTGIGTLAILGSGSFGSYIAAGVITVFSAAILLVSFQVFSSIAEKMKDQKEPSVPQLFFTALFGVCILYDFYTSFYGAKFVTFEVTADDANQVHYDTTFSKWLVVFMLTILSVSATMICSWIYCDNQKKDV